MSEESKSTICVMADVGMAPYAWLRSPGSAPPTVGGNIADAVSGFEANYNVSLELQDEFARWAFEYEVASERPEFDWVRWNEQGIALARRLKREVGERFLVKYHYPCEDRHRGGEIVDIDQ